jgi:endonuclease/exonuclease/phosphatase family metal-dependent hydrolase
MRPDFVGLQEVDQGVGRSESVNQPSELAKRLKMDAAFGSFMSYGGGEYGLAILSRRPIKSARALRLLNGNEPRVALFVDVVLPDGQAVTLVNVHFDWVDDDGFRFAQATQLAGVLKTLQTPYVLLGDFNDEPGSRTIRLFQGLAAEAKKPSADRFTFSSIRPEKEIDFIFAGPADRWKIGAAKVQDVAIVSDHRPVIAALTLKPTAP